MESLAKLFVKVTLDVERPSCVDPFAVGYSVLMQFFSCYSNNNRSIYSIVLCGTTFGGVLMAKHNFV